ncbi:MAG: polysaccharide deacetylase family protein [Proteobacteria bacterium]|nr:polysaccharide deacetylase family protein [Pseudomonadota bacterium]
MALRAYLTIDDSPSARTGDLTEALEKRGIPALLFCRGDRLEQNPAPVARGIQKGFVIGNHAWSHTRFSALPFETCVVEIEKTEKLIDAAYRDAGIARPGKYFRFPHMDRGAGGWVIDYDTVPAHRDALLKLFDDGLNISLQKPSADMLEKKEKLQEYLKKSGFTAPFAASFPFYAETEMATAIDAMFTFSTADWMLTKRHLGKWPYKTLDDLRKKMDDDPWLWQEDGAHIILSHDQEETVDTTIALVDYMVARGFEFLKCGE